MTKWLATSDRQLVIVVFYAPWAGSYELLNGFLQMLQVRIPNISIARVNIEKHPELAAKMRISNVPTTVLFRNHEVVDMFAGAISRKKLTAKITPYL